MKIKCNVIILICNKKKNMKKIYYYVFRNFFFKGFLYCFNESKVFIYCLEKIK